MDIQYYGANCFKLSSKKASIVVDDNLEKFGKKSIITNQDIAVYTFDKPTVSNARFLITGPGEYEISETSVLGVAARAHVDESGTRATMYSVRFGDYNIVTLGHIDPELSDDQIERLGIVDVLIVPVGGNGFTLDAGGAIKLIKKIEPKIVIPSHFDVSGFTYEVLQSSLEVFIKEFGVSEVETLDVLKLKDSSLGDKIKTVVLNIK